MSERTAYLAPEEFVDEVRNELKHVESVHDRLVIASGQPQRSVWAQNIWYDPQQLKIRSIGDAAKQLKAIQRNWVLYPSLLHRRAQLIAEALPHVSAKPIRFGSELNHSQLGSWTLIDNDTILASARCSSTAPNGEYHFEENHVDPPSRAYLKLWEALYRLGVSPKPGDRCLDAGASPGGWTWVLAELGAAVRAVDRSPLENGLDSRRNVQVEKGDAFAVLPSRGESFTWVLSDMACYPEKLFEWAKAWAESGKADHILCTLKFQGKSEGKSHADIIQRFLAIPHSELIHLFHNKHELTWFFARER